MIVIVTNTCQNKWIDVVQVFRASITVATPLRHYPLRSVLHKLIGVHILLASLQTSCLHRLSRVAFTSLTALSHILSHSLTYGIIPYTQSFTHLRHYPIYSVIYFTYGIIPYTQDTNPLSSFRRLRFVFEHSGRHQSLFSTTRSSKRVVVSVT